jgi:hypothetical protein
MNVRLYFESLLARQPAVGLVLWEKRDGLAAFLAALPERLKHASHATIRLDRIDASAMTSDRFAAELMKAVDAKATKRVLVIYDIEPLACYAASVLNSTRERLGFSRAVIVCLRANRLRDFASNAPDLMSWIGSNVAHLFDLQPCLAKGDVDAALRLLERRHHLKTKTFLMLDAKEASRRVKDAWIWRELVTIARAMTGRERHD